MNPTMQTILSRQTVREFTADPVPPEALDAVLQAALRAPSARNKQPVHLRVITDKALLDEMNVDFKNLVGWDTPAYTLWDKHPVYHNAPVFVFLVSENGAAMDAGLMAENIALAAASLGLGSCMVGSLGALFRDDACRAKWNAILEIPREWHFDLGIALGVPAETPPMKDREDGHVKFIQKKETL